MIRKSEPSPEQLENNEQPNNPSSRGATSQEEVLSDGEVHGDEKYGDWMVVLHKKRYNRKQARNPNVTHEVSARVGELNMPSAPKKSFLTEVGMAREK